MKIHHNTLKKAKAHKIELRVEDNEVVAYFGEQRLAAGIAGNVVLQTAIDKLGGNKPEVRAVARGKAPASQPSKPAKPGKKPSAYELAARDEGWTPKSGGGFKQADAGDEEGGDSDAKDWRALCSEQEIEVEGDDDEGKSIIKRKYKTRYRPFKMTCGDDLTAQLREHLTYVDDGDVERIDEDLLKRFAQANECWVPDYARLNVGQRRMNVGNRLRAKVRRDEYKIKWVK